MALKYKVGDRVTIKSLNWYNENKTIHGDIWLDNAVFVEGQSLYCGCELTIHLVTNDSYYVIENDYYWTDEMIECKVEEETKPEPKFKVGDKITNGKDHLTILQIISVPGKYIVEDSFGECGTLYFTTQDNWKLMEEGTKTKFKVGDKVITNKGYIGKFEGWVSDYQVRVLFEESGCNVVIHPKDLKLMEEETYDFLKTDNKTNLPSLNDFMDMLNNEIKLPEGYQFKDENGNVINATKIVLEKKKKEYPKTYEECEKILGLEDSIIEGCLGYEYKLLNAFQKLLMCRDAYWKIAGDKMGLGKPWEPDWENPDHDSYPTITRCDGKIIKTTIYTYDCPFAFPTPEMRDAFKKNFDPDIEFCKELL